MGHFANLLFLHWPEGYLLSISCFPPLLCQGRCKTTSSKLWLSSPALPRTFQRLGCKNKHLIFSKNLMFAKCYVGLWLSIKQQRRNQDLYIIACWINKQQHLNSCLSFVPAVLCPKIQFKKICLCLFLQYEEYWNTLHKLCCCLQSICSHIRLSFLHI